MARRQRPLSREDRKLWDSVAGTVRPIGSDLTGARAKLRRSASLPDPEPTEETFATEASAAAPLPRFSIGERAQTAVPGHDLMPPLAERLSINQIDRRTSRRIRKGGQGPEARIDLHGMTQAQAHPVLLRFVSRAHADDLRMVLVITGKGKDRDDGGPLPVPVGVLRHQVPHWLSLAPLRQMVLRIAPAQRQHGGEGAYYVFLRRRR